MKSSEAETAQLMDDYSLEMTAKDIESLTSASNAISTGTSISVTFLPGEAMPARVAAATAVKKLGYLPVPHISARRLGSREELTEFLGKLHDSVGIDSAFVVAGDPLEPMGPFEDALSIIESGELEKFGVKSVGISGYPEGHPSIPRPKLWAALKAKHRALTELGHDIQIVTQFTFDSDPVLQWLERVRQEAGIDAIVRVGLPGPASVKTLLRFAMRCGVAASAKVMAKYGTSITQLLNTAGPEKLIEEFGDRLDPRIHGDVQFHFYPFGGLKRTAEWVANYREGRSEGSRRVAD